MICLFDIDGTLVSAYGAGRRAFERALFEIYGLEDGLRGVQLDGKTDPLILDEALAAAGRGPADPDGRARVFAAYLTHLPITLAEARVQVLPGVERALTHLEARGVTVGLQTGNVEGGARCKLERADLWRRFSFGGYGSDAHARADLVRVAIARGRALARHGARAEVWVIGDTPRDVEAAHAAGARAVGVATGSYDAATLARAGAEVVAATLDDWIDRLSA